MILDEVIRTAEWGDVAAVLGRAYRRSAAELRALEEEWHQLRGLAPVSSRLVIVVEPYAPHEEFLEAIADGAAAVYGIDDDAAVSADGAGRPVRFNLSCTPRRKWLGMRLAAEALQRYTAPALAAHCLSEMTFMGVTEAAVRARIAAATAPDDGDAGPDEDQS